jgi:hypothetical protein
MLWVLHFDAAEADEDVSSASSARRLERSCHSYALAVARFEKLKAAGQLSGEHANTARLAHEALARCATAGAIVHR